MTKDSTTPPKNNKLPPPQTAPDNLPMNLQGFDTEDHARAFADIIAGYVRALSSHIDLTDLDGITIAGDYANALLNLDRGYETSFKLTPSESIAWGVAMTPAVMRDGKVKSHMIFRTGVPLPLADEKSALFQQALHILTHECAHVEVTSRFNAAFPGVLLQTKHPNAHVHYRWEIIKACWDEYAVTQICAPFGERATDGYEERFIKSLLMTRDHANSLIKAYRTHSDLQQVTGEVYGAYGELMKFSCYHIGNIVGLGLKVDDLPKTKAALENHWFAPHFTELQ